VEAKAQMADPFDFDAFLAHSQPFDQAPSETDYSSWPAESSPAPAEAHEHDDELAEFFGHEHEDLHETDESGDDSENNEEVDEDLDDVELEFAPEDEDAFEYVFEDELEAGDFEAEDHWDWDSEGSDSLFVDQNRTVSRNINDFSASLEDILSNVRRNHARALDLVSELQLAHAQHPFAHDQAPGNFLRRESVGAPRDNQRQNQRHHPYGMPQDRNRALGRMPAHEGRRSNLFRDELVEVEMQPPRAISRQNRAPASRQPEIIDLTGEPDSPDEPEVVRQPAARAPSAPQNPGRNPRRNLSSLQRTPSLSRSDGSLLGNNANVIDLTLDDSPAAPPPPLQLPRRNPPDGHQHRRHGRDHRFPAAPPQPAGMERPARPALFGGRIASLLRQLTYGRPNADQMEVQILGAHMDPLAGNIPNLDYGGHGHRGGAAPKPQHVPPPAAREGFTRDTGSEDDVIVCPSCEQELKYDPDAADRNSMLPPSNKKARTRKDQEEHYFWALKECGHVSLAWQSTQHFFFASY
jgi:hypothetical protein